MGGGHSRMGEKEALVDTLRANYPLAHSLYKLPLGALAEGASGRARTQLQALLRPGGGPMDHRSSARGHAALRDRLQGMKDVTLALALRIYTPDSMKLVREWFVSSTKDFSLSVKPMNFIKSQEEIQTSINSWVRSKTKNHIDELIPSETIYSIIQLLLVCAAYFQCDLEYPFCAVNTTCDLFYVNSKDVRAVKLMHQVNIFRYAELDSLKCQVLEMPYKNSDLRFVILLPFAVDGLPALEQDFVHIDFLELLNHMVYTKLLVSIPSFRLQENYDFCEYLDKIGLSSLLSSSERPFMKISEEDPPASLTHFNHMFAFNFMEDHKETVPSGVKKPAIEPDTVVFRADHSFMFIVLDVTLNMIFVIGRVNCLNNFTTPVFDKTAFDQLDELCQQYLDEQVHLSPEMIEETVGTTETSSESVDETAQAADEMDITIGDSIEVHEQVYKNYESYIRFNDNLAISSY